MNPGLIWLLFVTLVWGTTFPLIKSATSTLSGVEICALRFSIAALCLMPFAWRAPREVWRAGAVLGCLGLFSYQTQAVGLSYISANRSAFLTSLSVLLVPLVARAFGLSTGKQGLIAAILACIGVGLLSWDGNNDWVGDLLTLSCALSYTFYLIFLSRCVVQHRTIQLAATQLLVMASLACLSIGLMSLFDPSTENSLQNFAKRAHTHWPELIFLGTVATALVVFLQALAQRYVSATQAALIYAMEPVFATFFSGWWLHETFGTQAILGAAFIVCALILSQMPRRKI